MLIHNDTLQKGMLHNGTFSKRYVTQWYFTKTVRYKTVRVTKWYVYKTVHNHKMVHFTKTVYYKKVQLQMVCYKMVDRHYVMLHQLAGIMMTMNYVKNIPSPQILIEIK